MISSFHMLHAACMQTLGVPAALCSIDFVACSFCVGRVKCNQVS